MPLIKADIKQMPLPYENGTVEYTVRRYAVRQITFPIEICTRITEYSSTITILNGNKYM